MRKSLDSETKIFTACLGVAIIFAGLIVKDFLQKNAMEQSLNEAKLVPGISAKEVLANRIEFLGAKSAPYTLVEFGDYQCPPCRMNQDKIADVLLRYKDKINLDFRQFPLTEIHPKALPMALVAEANRSKGQGQFWPMHKRLFTTKVSAPLPPITASERSLAKKQVSSDEFLARRLEVKGTPSFFVCRPDGKVFSLSGIEALEKAL